MRRIVMALILMSPAVTSGQPADAMRILSTLTGVVPDCVQVLWSCDDCDDIIGETHIHESGLMLTTDVITPGDHVVTIQAQDLCTGESTTDQVIIRAGYECHEVGWVVNEISYWGHVFGLGDRYSYARWWYGGPVCLDGGMVY